MLLGRLLEVREIMTKFAVLDEGCFYERLRQCLCGIEL